MGHATVLKWIKENRLVPCRFEWQEGYGAFSYAKSQVDAVVKYILHQEEHHKKKTFNDEYREFLDKYGVEYNPMIEFFNWFV